MARTYFCNCGGKVEEGEDMTCECGYVFGNKPFKTSNHVNMRTTWSGQTQVEFSQQSMQESVEGMGGEW
jgi:hypothetical protein